MEDFGERGITNGTEWGPGEPGGCGEMKVQMEEGLAPFQEGKRERGVGFRTRAV